MHAGTPKPDLKDLVVLPISDCFSLGDQLNIPRVKLLEIKNYFHHDPQTCKRKVFQCWLESTPQASYHQLVVALRNTADYSLAEELCKKYSKRLLIGTLQKQSGCFNHRVVTQVAVSWRTVVMKGLLW